MARGGRVLGPVLLCLFAARAPGASPAPSDLELQYFPPANAPELRLSSPAIEKLQVLGDFPVHDWNVGVPTEKLVGELSPPEAAVATVGEPREEGHPASGPIEFPPGLAGSAFHFGAGLVISPPVPGEDPVGRGFRLPRPALGITPPGAPGTAYPLPRGLTLESGVDGEEPEDPTTPADGADSRVWSGVVFNF